MAGLECCAKEFGFYPGDIDILLRLFSWKVVWSILLFGKTILLAVWRNGGVISEAWAPGDPVAVQAKMAKARCGAGEENVREVSGFGGIDMRQVGRYLG